MKKGWKIFAIVCAVVAGIGITLCIAGFAIGATMQEVRNVFDRGIGFGPGVHHIGRDIQTEELDEKLDADWGHSDFRGIRAIEVEVGKVQVEVIPTDEEVVKVEHQVDDRLHFECHESGSVLKIKTREKHFKADYGSTIQIYIPRDLMLAEADFSIGAGTLKVTGLKANELNIECGAAAVQMGNIEADNVNIECGAGQIEYAAQGHEHDYNYNVEIGAGEVNIAESSFSGLAVDKKINNNANKNMSIECGAGQVAVTFEE